MGRIIPYTTENKKIFQNHQPVIVWQLQVCVNYSFYNDYNDVTDEIHVNKLCEVYKCVNATIVPDDGNDKW